MKDILDRLMEGTKDDLMEAAMRLGLPPIRRSAKKAQWAEHIIQGWMNTASKTALAGNVPPGLLLCREMIIEPA